MKSIYLPLIAAIFALCSCVNEAGQSALAKEFENPGPENRPWVFWFWNNGNLTKEGITADLEAMKRVGIGGVLIMEVGQGAPQGEYIFMSDPWREMYKFMVSEAERLGIEINMNNDAGWNGSGGSWITPEYGMQKLTWSEVRVTGPSTVKATLPEPPKIRDYYRDIAILAFPTPADLSKLDTIFPNNPVTSLRRKKLDNKAIIAQEAIIDISGKMKPDGSLEWQAPAGKWTIIRIGHTSTGRIVGPTPAGYDGLECDKLSVKAAELAFNGQMAQLIADSPNSSGEGKTLVCTHIDSWENGTQTWTPLMKEDFFQRRNYDIMKFLPVFAGYVIDSPDITDRFLWDFRRTVSELTLDNYVGTFQRLAHQHGLKLSTEAYDSPCDFLQFAGMSDEPVGEFWMPNGSRLHDCRGMASAGHVYGKKIIGVEAFTSSNDERWLQHPGSMKILGDKAFAEGVNRFIFHRYSFQPWKDVKPGLMMGPWGVHYERTQTWWELTPSWHEYLSRCQFMLRQGQFRADIAYIEEEDSPQDFPLHPLNGYPWDQCGADAVYQMNVTDGKLILPSGAEYEILVMPKGNRVTAALLTKITQLVKDGATVIGDKPEGSFGLTDYMSNEQKVKALADELWGDVSGISGEHTYGKGRIIWGKQPEDVLLGKGIKPDFISNIKLSENHRYTDKEDIYFIANPNEQNVLAEVELRALGTPEIWFPETGKMIKAPVFSVSGNVTKVLLPLKATESVFVVFPRKGSPAAGEHFVSVSFDGKPVSASLLGLDEKGLSFCSSGDYELLTSSGKKIVNKVVMSKDYEFTGAWNVKFPSKDMVLDQLVSWSDSPDEFVKYFSGTAVYTKSFKLPDNFVADGQRVILDLGKVEAIA
ncbi:MAG: hypothetical protein LBR18_01825, partial [Tannerella sp.]|nr:hypothetical protein [Tannerella sp.]